MLVVVRVRQTVTVPELVQCARSAVGGARAVVVAVVQSQVVFADATVPVAAESIARAVVTDVEVVDGSGGVREDVDSPCQGFPAALGQRTR